VVIGAALATFAWLGVQTAYATFVAAHFGQSHPGPHSLEEMLTPADYAVLSTVPGLVGFLVLLVTDYALSPQLPAQLGLAPQRALDGLVKGIFASLVILPLVFCGAVLLEVFYNAIHYKPPGAHELLLVMQATDNPIIRSILIVGACAIAPACEEYLFRGHLQTILVRLFHPDHLIPVAPPPSSIPDPALALSDGPAVLHYPAPMYQRIPHERSPIRIWLAVVVTSILFALIHPLWMAPLIFVLSLGLGYAYERTGNLWTNIFIHALFNTANTFLFLHSSM
jgi:membrane protease YdiL (CAAX protease family)